MTKYFLNIRSSGLTEKDDEKTYKFDLETPLLFPSALLNKKVEYKYLKVQTQQAESEFFRNVNHKINIISGFSPIEHYWKFMRPWRYERIFLACW